MCGMTCWPASQDRAITLWARPPRPSCNAHAAAQTATSNHAGRLLHLRQGRVHGSGGGQASNTRGAARSGSRGQTGPLQPVGSSRRRDEGRWSQPGPRRSGRRQQLAQAAALRKAGWRSGSAQPAAAKLHLTVLAILLAAVLAGLAGTRLAARPSSSRVQARAAVRVQVSSAPCGGMVMS